ncbi:MAG: hypothetical protein GYA23_04915 [Methanomicrobiales archaeon]|nr:hypothetical protein [Methanomicrobiales archaeon]
MFGRQERTALLLLIGVAALVLAAHGILTLQGKQPFAHPFTNATPDGELVFFSGTIENAATTKTGGHVILEVSNQTIFIPAPAAGDRSFFKGQRVSVFGIVETYRGKKEIVVETAGDIQVTNPYPQPQ